MQICSIKAGLITEIFLGMVTQILCWPSSLEASGELVHQAVLCITLLLNTAWDYKYTYFVQLQSSTKIYRVALGTQGPVENKSLTAEAIT